MTTKTPRWLLRHLDAAHDTDTERETFAPARLATPGLQEAFALPRLDVQTFTANGTWTKPTGALTVHVRLVSAGGGGGAGRRGAAATARVGGGGGGGGAVQEALLQADLLPSTVAVTVGTGGSGGAPTATDDTNGANGNGGSPSTFGSYLLTGSSGGGSGGQAGAAGGGGFAASPALLAGNTGGSASTTGAVGPAGGAAAGGGRGGGAGGGITTANATSNGGAGGSGGGMPAVSGGTTAGAAPAAGGTPLSGAGLPGSGGGGGASSITAAAQTGAAGGNYGAGGGGGGASLNGFTAGGGGRGGDGLVVVTTTVHRLPYLGARSRPVVPANGTTLMGVQTLNPATDIAPFLAGTGTTSVAIYNAFTQSNGTFAGAIADAASIGSADLAIAWGFDGSSNGGQAGIAAGNFDAYITARANELRAYGKPVYLRLNWEFQGNWYAWSPFDLSNNPRPGNTPADFVAAWRRVVGIFRQIAPNAAFVWCPHLWAPVQPATSHYVTTDWYPGDDYVDWVATNLYLAAASWDFIESGSGWGATQIADFAVAHGKPMQICEWATQGSLNDDAGIMAQFANWVDAHPVVKALIYYEFDHTSTAGQDYRIENKPNSAFAYRTRFTNVARYRTQPG